jgi:hypothetical protein
MIKLYRAYLQFRDSHSKPAGTLMTLEELWIAYEKFKTFIFLNCSSLIIMQVLISALLTAPLFSSEDLWI